MEGFVIAGKAKTVFRLIELKAKREEALKSEKKRKRKWQSWTRWVRCNDLRIRTRTVLSLAYLRHGSIGDTSGQSNPTKDYEQITLKSGQGKVYIPPKT